MKRLVSTAAAAALSVLAVAGAAQAGPAANAIQSLDSGQYRVVRIDSLDSDAAYGVNALAAVDASAVQQAIRSNPALVRELQARNVQIDNVVAAKQAMNGSVVFYLR